MRRPERFQAALVIWRCGTRGSSSAKGLILRAFAVFCPIGVGGYGTLCGRADFPGRPCGHMGDRRCRTSNTGWSIRACGRARPSSKCRAGPASRRREPTARTNMPGIARPSPKARNTASRSFTPMRTSCMSQQKNGVLHFDGDFGEAPDDDLQWPPFRKFGSDYYTHQLLLDLKVGADWAVRTEPHPRFYTDTTGTVPIAVPALLRTEWWPMISFIVFKSPREGEVHIFRPGEPMLQILVLPVTCDINLVPMDEEEAAEREMRGRRIHATRPIRLPRTPPGRRTPTPSLTAPIATCCAQQKAGPTSDPALAATTFSGRSRCGGGDGGDDGGRDDGGDGPPGSARHDDGDGGDDGRTAPRPGPSSHCAPRLRAAHHRP